MAKTHTDPGTRLILCSLAALGLAAVMTQLALMRELLGAFSGNELVLGIILGNWLLLTGLGAWLGRNTDRLKHPMRRFAVAQILIAVLPLAQIAAARALRNVVFLRGAMIGAGDTVASSFVLLLPFCVVSGYLLALGCAVLPSRSPASPLASVYVADSLGSVVGGALFSLLFVRWLDHFALLCIPAAVNLAMAGWVARKTGQRFWLGVVVTVALALAALVSFGNVDARLTALQYPRQRVVFSGNSPYGRLVVTESAGQFNFIENGLTLFATPNTEQVEETVHYAMAQRPDAAQVLLVSGGVSGTTREILKYAGASVTDIELDPLIIAAGRRFLPNNLADPRIRVVNTDGRLFIRRTDRRFDVVIVDVPAPTTSQLNRFFTAEYFAEVKRVLAPGGVLSLALGQYENYMSPELARLLASMQHTLLTSFAHVLVLPGGRVFFLASDGVLRADVAPLLEARQIATRFVTRHALAAMFTPDRMAAVQQATQQTAAVNRDFSPVLYYYHLRYWASQVQARFGWLAGSLLLALAVYLARLRAVPLAIFASGFTASALQVVLLLALQILRGALYQQLGLVVTAFMAGLWAGAGWMQGRQPRAPRPRLAALAFALAAFAALLPLGLKLIAGAPGHGLRFALAPACVPVLSFALAMLVGAEFPLAGQAHAGRATAVAATLYAADCLGACLGALLASTLVIPLLGVTALCGLTAVLNGASGARLLATRG